MSNNKVEQILESYDKSVKNIIEKYAEIKPIVPKPINLEQIRVNIPRNPLIENMEDNYASAFYDRLKKWINEFDASLDQEHEVGVRLVNFGQTVVFHLEGMGYYNPSLILFYGNTEDGNPVELIQHVSQISILLTKLQRKDPSIPKKPIGFASEVSQDENAGK
jgi:hypothetical protein